MLVQNTATTELPPAVPASRETECISAVFRTHSAMLAGGAVWTLWRGSCTVAHTSRPTFFPVRERNPFRTHKYEFACSLSQHSTHWLSTAHIKLQVRHLYTGRSKLRAFDWKRSKSKYQTTPNLVQQNAAFWFTVRLYKTVRSIYKPESMIAWCPSIQRMALTLKHKTWQKKKTVGKNQLRGNCGLECPSLQQMLLFIYVFLKLL